MALVPNTLRAAGLGWGPDWIKMLFGGRGRGGGGGSSQKSDSYYADIDAKKRAQNYSGKAAFEGKSMQGGTSIPELIELFRSNPFKNPL